MAEIPWIWLAIRASGVTAWALLTAVVLWGLLLRSRLLGSLVPSLRLLHLHRWLGALALAFLAVHLGLLLVDPAVRFTAVEILVPGLAPWQTVAVGLGTVAFWLILGVSIVGRIRTRLGRAGNAVFARAHVLSYAAWPLATAHYVMAGTDALAEWSLGLLLAGSSLVILALLARSFVPAPARILGRSDSPTSTAEPDTRPLTRA